MLSNMRALLLLFCPFLAVFASPPLQPISNFGNGFLDNPDTAGLESFRIPTPRYRLPRDVTPKHYIIRQRPILRADPDQFTAPSDVTITVICDRATAEIVLHRHNYTIDIKTNDVKITRISDGSTQVITGQTSDDDKDFYIFNLQVPLVVTEIYEIFIPFTARVTVSDTLSDLVGLYGSYYFDPADPDTRRYLSTTKLEPFHARKVFPCFDEPELKATFNIIIGRHTDYHSLSNMMNKTTTEITELPGWEWDDYESTVEMSTYLVCMIVSDFASVTAMNGEFNKPVSTWAPKYIIDQNGGVYAANEADRILVYLESKLKIPYALPKMDSISIPQFPSGAMENWGLNTYRESLLIYYPNISTEADRSRINNVLTHELAHQWWGNLVTCKWWSDIWLQEGFATFLSFDQKTAPPEFDFDTRFVTDVVQLAMRFDQGPLTHPVKNAAVAPAEIVSVFSRISYEKAASLIRMMEGYLTEGNLWNGLLKYLNEFASKVAEQDDLFQILNEFSQNVLPAGLTVKEIMDTWTLKSGYPLVKVSAAGSKRIYISQEKFVLNPNDPQPSELWYTPITVITSENPDESSSLWMSKYDILVSHQVNDTSKWIMLNPNGIGYYRVHYDPAMFQLVVDQLNKEHTVISPASRSQLLDDYLNFAFLADYADVATALELTRYLAKEKELVVWNAVLTNLREPINKLTGTNGILAVEYYLRPRVEAALKMVEEQELGAGAILRSVLMEWACSLGSEECIQYSEGLLEDWINDETNLRILADIQSVVFCAGVSRKRQPELDFLHSKYTDVSTHETIKIRLLNAMACVEDPILLNRLLADAISPGSGIREADRVPLLQRIVANSKGRDLAYDFVTDEFDQVGPARFAAVVSSLSTYWHTTENRNKLENFIGQHETELVDVMGSLNESLANIAANILWIERIGKPMAAWMIAH